MQNSRFSIEMQRQRNVPAREPQDEGEWPEGGHGDEEDPPGQVGLPADVQHGQRDRVPEERAEEMAEQEHPHGLQRCPRLLQVLGDEPVDRSVQPAREVCEPSSASKSPIRVNRERHARRGTACARRPEAGA